MEDIPEKVQKDKSKTFIDSASKMGDEEGKEEDNGSPIYRISVEGPKSAKYSTKFS